MYFNELTITVCNDKEHRIHGKQEKNMILKFHRGSNPSTNFWRIDDIPNILIIIFLIYT